MGRSSKEKVIGDTAREVCVRSNSKVLIAGFIEPLANQYLLGLNAMNCANGEFIVQEQVQADRKQDVLKAIDMAAKQLRGKLGESIGSVQKFGVPIEQATTTSLEALQAYSLGIRTWYEQGDDAAIPFYKRAMELDPNFALAYASATSSYSNLGMISEAIACGTKAYQLRDRVSERERYFITAFYHSFAQGDLETSIADYQLWQRTYLRDPWATGDLGVTYAMLGQLQNALRENERALEIGLDDELAYANLAGAYISVNRLADAQRILDLAQQRKFGGGFLALNRYYLAFMKHDSAGMEDELARVAGKRGSEDPLLAAQADSETYHGRIAKAREFSRKAAASAAGRGATETAATWTAVGALHEVEIGYPALARDLAFSALKSSSGRDVQIVAALALARAGEGAKARSIAEPLHKQYPQNTLIEKYWLP